jgi:hypothetical protein
LYILEITLRSVNKPLIRGRERERERDLERERERS